MSEQQILNNDMVIIPTCTNCKHWFIGKNIHHASFYEHYCRIKDNYPDIKLCIDWELSKPHARYAAAARIRFLKESR